MKKTLVAHVVTRKKVITIKELHALLYFLNAAGVPVPWSFRLHHYGPYSFVLAYELEQLELEGVIRKKNQK